VSAIANRLSRRSGRSRIRQRQKQRGQPEVAEIMMSRRRPATKPASEPKAEPRRSASETIVTSSRLALPWPIESPANQLPAGSRRRDERSCLQCLFHPPLADRCFGIKTVTMLSEERSTLGSIWICFSGLTSD